MKYLKSIKKNDLIGITAVSCGLGNRIEELESSKNNLSEFRFIETDNVRSMDIVSSSSEERCKELEELFLNDEVSCIFCATGGDFCLEMLDKLNFDIIKDNPKWIMGASDPTSILYLITTKLDIATLYGMNAASFSGSLHQCHKNTIEILKGNIERQESFKKYDVQTGFGDYDLSGDVYWKSDKDINIEGRIIGGCFDVLLNILGTNFDYTKEFIERYKDDGIIWYFDIFSKNTVDVYLGLLQMKMAGWFKYIKGIVVGRVKYPESFIEDFDYFDAVKRVFGEDFPIIMDADIGHVFPKMTIINGSYAYINCSMGKGYIEMELK